VSGAQQEQAILELLLEHGGWMYGLELVKASSGRLGRGTVYIHLDNLEVRGHVESREEPLSTGLPRRQYRITNSGRGRLAESELRGLTPEGA
jgi:DNA-binding PadR family transcriptional regulator